MRGVRAAMKAATILAGVRVHPSIMGGCREDTWVLVRRLAKGRRLWAESCDIALSKNRANSQKRSRHHTQKGAHTQKSRYSTNVQSPTAMRVRQVASNLLRHLHL